MESSRYRIGVELGSSSTGAVLIERSGNTCTVLDARRFSRNPDDSGDQRDLPGVVAELRPKDCDWISATVIIPPERTLEAYFQVPRASQIDRDDWERWEVSMHLIGSARDYLFDSYDSGTSPCGTFRNSDVLAVKRDYVEALMSSAAKKHICLDRVCFPQSLWSRLLNVSAEGGDRRGYGCLYVEGSTASMIRTNDSRVARISYMKTGAEKTASVAEFIDALLSWHGRDRRSRGMLLVNASDDRSSADELMSQYKLDSYDSTAMSGIFPDSVANPERFLLPLAALGII